MLAVLALAVHPFELPGQGRAIRLDLLPPLTPPPMPTVEIQLRPRQTDRAPPPEPRPAPAPPRPAVSPSQPAQEKPVEVERRPVQAPRLQTRQAAPQIPEAPPEPVAVTRQAPALQPQVEVPHAQVQGRQRPLDASRAAPQVPEAAAPQSQVQALTNETVIQAPVEIRPRDRRPASSALTTQQPGVPAIPAPDGGAPPAGAAADGGGPGRPTAEDFKGIQGLKGGLRSALGCEDPDAYKLSEEDRAACLQRFGQRAKEAPDLGLPISARKQAEYDRYRACQNAYTLNQGAIPNSYETFGGSSIPGVAPKPKECR